MKANLTTVCRLEAQEEIRLFLIRSFADLQVSESLKNQMILAIDEAVANAILHGNDHDPDRSIQINLDLNPKRLSVEIFDIGLFDELKRDETKNRDIKDIIREKRKGGMGVKLIYSIMDIVNFYTKNNISYIHMVKLLDPKKTD